MTDVATTATLRLTMLRNTAGLTQRELAERIGVEPRELRRWEHGKDPIPVERALTLAEQFQVSPEFLLGGDA